MDIVESVHIRTQRGLRTTLIGVMINTLLAVIKILSGIFGHSYALIADGIESTMDIVSSTIVWGGIKIASKPPDDNHPYGHGKAEPLAAIVVALALIGAGIAIAVESINEIVTPHHAPAPFTLIVLVLVVATKELLFRFVTKIGKDVDSTAMKTDAWHHRSDAITSLAAFIGISVALIFGNGYESADDWAALFACLVIWFNGFRLFKMAIAEIMDSAPPEEYESIVREIAGAVPDVVEIEKCRIRKSGLNYFVDIHVEVDGEMTVRRGHKIAHQVKDELCQADMGIYDVLVHIEPHESDVKKKNGLS